VVEVVETTALEASVKLTPVPVVFVATIPAATPSGIAVVNVYVLPAIEAEVPVIALVVTTETVNTYVWPGMITYPAAGMFNNESVGFRPLITQVVVPRTTVVPP